MNIFQLFSLNCEGNKHLSNRILPFLRTHLPDVFHFQEVFLSDVVQLESLGYRVWYQPYTKVGTAQPHLPVNGILGIAQCLKKDSWLDSKLVGNQAKYYFGAEQAAADGLVLLSDAEKQQLAQYGATEYNVENSSLPIFFYNENPNAMLRALQWLSFEIAGQVFNTAHTHFTWSVHGVFTAEQQRDYLALQQLINQNLGTDFIFTGDLNSPRQAGVDNVYSMLAAKYRDHIPAELTTSIDNNLHKSNNHIELVVDGLFSSGEVEARNTTIIKDVSDHYGVLADIIFKAK